MADKKEETDAPKKKGKGKLIVMIVVALLVLGGGGAGGWYMMKGSGAHAAEPAGPQLVPKAEQVRAGAGGEGGHDGGGSHGGTAPPSGVGGDRYASTYYTLDKDFTSNLRESVHFVQVGVAVSTPYDETVIENLRTNEIAVRSAILMTLGDTTEEQVFTSDGKQQLQRRLTVAINNTLKQKEGFGGISNVYFTNFVVQ